MSSGPSPDAELHAVRFAFDAALRRICEAATTDELTAELSNLLHHLFRLRELYRVRMRGHPPAALSQDVAAAVGACWARHLDTHRLFVTAADADLYSDYYTNKYGLLVWKRPRHCPQGRVTVTGALSRRHCLKAGRCSIPCAGPSTRWPACCEATHARRGAGFDQTQP
jgi:hypothetical protein